MCGKPALIRAAPQFVHTAQGALLVDLGLITIAPCCAFARPRRLGDDRAAKNACVEILPEVRSGMTAHSRGRAGP